MQERMTRFTIRAALIAALAVLLPVAALAQSSAAPRTPWASPR